MDVESLSKKLLTTKTSDTPDIACFLIPEISPKSDLPKDQNRIEPYIRLRSIPSELMQMVICTIEAKNLSHKIFGIMPDLGLAQPTYHPNGMAELQWRLDDGSVFGLMVSNLRFVVEEEKDGLSLTKDVRLVWRFNGPKHSPEHGEFKNEAELLEFIAKNFVSK